MHSTPFRMSVSIIVALSGFCKKQFGTEDFKKILRPKLKNVLSLFHLRADHISRIQLIISAFLFDQFIMCTTLNDSSLFQYHNAVRITDCR